MAPRLLNRCGVGGIIGKLSFDPQEPLAQAVLEGMLDTFVRRGHEEHGVFMAPGIALGWCGSSCSTIAQGALSEIERRDDRAPASPVGTTERQNVRAVADSSISNAEYLRAQLEQLGRDLREHSDSELIAHAYAVWGLRCVERFRGPFACAIWDERARRLILARDHVGIRPLYFALLPSHGVVFASEIQALLHDPGVGREWCPEAIDAYLALGYIPAPLTAYGRISKLEPAHVVVVEGRRLRVEQYWDLPPATTTATPEARISAIDECLRATVDRELTDGYVNGVLYSGGTASSVLLSAIPRAAMTVVTTVAIEQEPSELARSYDAASHLGHVRLLEASTLPIPALATELGAHFEEPIADPSAIAQFAVCVAARRHTDCALAAHGAGVLWAGHARHAVNSLWDDFHRRAIYTRGFAWHVRDAHPFARHRELYASRDTADPLERALYVDARTFLPDSTLASMDRASLAAGLRLRLPFLDRDLVELAAGTPTALKQCGRIGMYALRRLLMRRLPRALMPAPPPCPPQHQWLRTALASMVPSVLLAPRFDGRGIVCRPALAQLWDEHRDGRRDHSHRLWSLLMLEFWFREFIDGDAAEEPLEYAVVKVA